MVAFGSGAKPAVVALVFAALTSLAGCSSTGSSNYSAAYSGTPVRGVAQVAKADVEDDGMPAQTPPPVRANEPPDDPTEPYSRNYGGENPAVLPTEAPREKRLVPAPARKPLRPMPAQARENLKTALVQDE